MGVPQSRFSQLRVRMLESFGPKVSGRSVDVTMRLNLQEVSRVWFVLYAAHHACGAHSYQVGMARGGGKAAGP